MRPSNSLRYDPWLSSVLLGFTILTWASWGKLASLMLDTGHEVNIPVQMLAGQLLYRDIEINYGPLTYYVNTFVVQLLGQRMEVFFILGLVIALGVILLVYHLTKLLTNRTWAALCCAYLMIHIAFTPWGAPGDMAGITNFVVPYSYGIVYGTLLSLIAITSLERYGYTGNAIWLVISAIASGFAGLCKQEYGVAALGSLLVGLNFCSFPNLKTRIGHNLLIILAGSASVIIPLVWLSHIVSWKSIQLSLLPVAKLQVLVASGLFDFSLSKTIGIWMNSFNFFFNPALGVWVGLAVGRWISLHQWFSRKKAINYLIEIFTSITISFTVMLLLSMNYDYHHIPKLAAIPALLFILAIAIAYRLVKVKQLFHWRWLKTLVTLLLTFAVAALSIYVFRRSTCCTYLVFYPLSNISWIIPLLVIWFAWRWRQLIQLRHTPLLWTIFVFSILITSRFWFYFHYSLYAVTAIIVFFTFLYHLTEDTHLPVIQFLLVCLLIAVGMNFVEYAKYRYPVYSNQGILLTKDPSLALAYNQTIQTITNSGAKSVLVLPEGTVLNFLTATSSPSREVNLIPGIVPNPADQQDFLSRMQKNPPELIVYVDIPFFFLQPGYQKFAEYNSLIHNWIINKHRLIYTSPQLFFGEKEWHIRIYANTLN